MDVDRMSIGWMLKLHYLLSAGVRMLLCGPACVLFGFAAARSVSAFAKNSRSCWSHLFAA